MGRREEDLEACTLHTLKPGVRGRTSPKEGWTLENEIAWLEHYLEGQHLRLERLYAQRSWWERFILYCNTPTF